MKIRRRREPDHTLVGMPPPPSNEFTSQWQASRLSAQKEGSWIRPKKTAPTPQSYVVPAQTYVNSRNVNPFAVLGERKVLWTPTVQQR